MSNNNDNGGAIFGIAILCAVLWFIMIAAYALACFIAAIFTILSIIAWNSPIRLGKLIIEPHEARQFVLCGMIGAVGLPVFVLFCEFLFDFRVEDKWWFYIWTGGYAFGSIGLSMMLEEHGAYIVEPLEVDLPPAFPAPPPAPQLPPAPRPPFEYASWNDEAEKTPFAKPECQGCWLNAAPHNPDTPVLNR